MNAMSLKKMVVVFALVSVLAGFAQADKLELQAKLSKEVKIQLKDVTIVEVLEEIRKKAGLEIVLSDKATWKLPQGGATRLSVMMKGPLAESLTEMLNAFFMRYAVGEERVTIHPRLELEHILGSPTTRQLELLKDIYTKRIEFYKLEDVQGTINEALGRPVLISPVRFQKDINGMLRELLSYFAALGEEKVELDPGQRFELPTPVTVAQLLRQHGWSWYLSGMDFPNQIPEIRVVDEDDFRRAKLEQIVDIYMEGDAAAIIQRLANWTGMELHWEKRDPLWPGGANLLVDMQNVKLGQALRNMASSASGVISTDIEHNYIRIAGPQHEKKPVARGRPPRARPKPRGADSGKIARAGGDYVGKISIPMDGGEYYIEFMLRESDLTEELRKLRDEKMEQILGRPPKPKPARETLKPAASPPKPAATRARPPTRRSE